MRPLNSILTPQLETKSARRRRRLSLFQAPFRKYIAGLTSTSPAIEDLAESFPALLFAMATGYGTAPAREAAFRAVTDGQSLKDAAALLGLPMWTRRIPPAALTEPLPRLPLDEAFAAEVVNRVPQVPAECANWLDRVLTGYRLLGRDMAIWIAREPRLMPPATGEDLFQWLLAWAWASVSPGSQAHGLLRGGWSPDAGLKRAIDELAVWRKRIDLVGAVGDPARDPWYPNAVIGPYEIVQLTTVSDFVIESTLMENCLDQYAAHLAYGRVRIYSVRRDGRPVADIEISVRADKPTEACLSQVRGPRNRRAPPGVWQAVTAWLSRQPSRPLLVTSTPTQLARQQLDLFWSPYLTAIAAAGLEQRLPASMVTRDRLRGDQRPPPPDLPAHLIGQREAMLRQIRARAAARAGDHN